MVPRGGGRQVRKISGLGRGGTPPVSGGCLCIFEKCPTAFMAGAGARIIGYAHAPCGHSARALHARMRAPKSVGPPEKGNAGHEAELAIKQRLDFGNGEVGALPFLLVMRRGFDFIKYQRHNPKGAGGVTVRHLRAIIFLSQNISELMPVSGVDQPTLPFSGGTPWPLERRWKAPSGRLLSACRIIAELRRDCQGVGAGPKARRWAGLRWARQCRI